jgi:hypothetical protein
MHRKMGEMYQTQIKGPNNRKPNPWLINMVKHRKQIAVKTDGLAGEEGEDGCPSPPASQGHAGVRGQDQLREYAPAAPAFVVAAATT